MKTFKDSLWGEVTCRYHLVEKIRKQSYRETSSKFLYLADKIVSGKNILWYNFKFTDSHIEVYLLGLMLPLKLSRDIYVSVIIDIIEHHIPSWGSTVKYCHVCFAAHNGNWNYISAYRMTQLHKEKKADNWYSDIVTCAHMHLWCQMTASCSAMVCVMGSFRGEAANLTADISFFEKWKLRCTFISSSKSHFCYPVLENLVMALGIFMSEQIGSWLLVTESTALCTHQMGPLICRQDFKGSLKMIYLTLYQSFWYIAKSRLMKLGSPLSS